MTTLREFLIHRIEVLRDELDECRRVLRALDAEHIKKPRTPKHLTIKMMIMGVLEDDPKGGKAIDLLCAVNKRYNRNIDRTCFSPSLSRLKREGRVAFNNGIWSLKKKGSLHDDSNLNP